MLVKSTFFIAIIMSEESLQQYFSSFKV